MKGWRTLTLLSRMGASTLFLSLASFALATPSGLNNIPTADITPPRKLVVQQINNLAIGGKYNGRHTVGFKMGLNRHVEVGWDGLLAHSGTPTGNGFLGAGGAPSFPTTFHFKYRAVLTRDWSVGFGIANLSPSASKAGHPAYYSVLSGDLGALRFHLGYLATKDDGGWFAGIDRTLRRLTLRADWLQMGYGRGDCVSVGFMYDLGSRFILEAWLSHPTPKGVKDTLTVKLNYVTAWW